ncbi:MAG: hypothetical protein ACE5FD_05210 [Anaerolineae bacterium]
MRPEPEEMTSQQMGQMAQFEKLQTQLMDRTLMAFAGIGLPTLASSLLRSMETVSGRRAFDDAIIDC